MSIENKIKNYTNVKNQICSISRYVWQPLPVLEYHLEKFKQIMRNKDIKPNELVIKYRPAENFLEKTNYQIKYFLIDEKDGIFNEYIFEGNKDQTFVHEFRSPTSLFIHNFKFSVVASCKVGIFGRDKKKLELTIPLNELQSQNSITKEFDTENNKHHFSVK